MFMPRREEVATARQFADDLGIDIQADEEGLGYNLRPRLATLANGETAQHICEDGADYTFSRLDLFLEGHLSIRPHASRMVAEIMGGNRTRLSYWSQTAPTKQLTVHRGSGQLVVANPEDVGTDTFDTRGYHIDSKINQYITVAPGRFHTLEAASRTPESLVVTGLYRAAQKVNWGKMETPFPPTQEAIEAPEGTIVVVENFVLGYLAPQLFTNPQ
jgi:hypothetical protein